MVNYACNFRKIIRIKVNFSVIFDIKIIKYDTNTIIILTQLGGGYKFAPQATHFPHSLIILTSLYFLTIAAKR